MYNFGPTAAQFDDNLLSYFHVTKQAESLIDFSIHKPSFIFVSRPGAGKTALKKWLAKGSEDRFALMVTYEKTRLSSSDKFLNVGDLSLMINTEIVISLISELANSKYISNNGRVIAKEFIAKGWWELLKKFFDRRFAGLSILGIGFKLKPEDRQLYLREIRQTGRLEKGRIILKKLAKEVNISLIIDDPELLVNMGLSAITVSNARRVGALLSALADIHSCGVRVIIFLKDNILQNTKAHYGDFKHFGDQIEALEWTAEDLNKMLELRILSRLNSNWSNIFSLNKKMLTNMVFPLLVNGPRDLISLCNLVGKEEGKITIGKFEKAFRSYKVEKWVDISTYYGDQWPRIDSFSRSMVNVLRHKYKKGNIPIGGVISEFEDQFATPASEIHKLRMIKNKWIDNAKWESPPIDERLFIIGCLGYKLNNRKFYPWASRDMEKFRIADSHFISPAFI